MTMTQSPLRELERVVALLEKATPGEWMYRAKSNTFHLPPPEGTTYSYGESIMDADEDYPTFKDEDVDAILGAVNFLREHGPALIAALGEGQEAGAVEPAWFYVRTPGADYDYTFTKTREEAIDLQDCDEPDEPIPLYASPAHTSEARDAARYGKLKELFRARFHRSTSDYWVMEGECRTDPRFFGEDAEQMTLDAALDAAMEANR